MNGHEQTGLGEAVSDINVIPLADLSLVLLIILMVLSPMILQSLIKVNATQAAAVATTAPQAPVEPPLMVVVAPRGITLNTVPMASFQEFSDRLSKELARRSNKTVLLTADPQVLHGSVVQILDTMKQRGASKVALVKKAQPSHKGSP